MSLEELLMEERKKDNGLKEAEKHRKDPEEAKVLEGDEGPAGVRAYEIKRSKGRWCEDEE